MELILTKNKDGITINNCRQGIIKEFDFHKNIKANWGKSAFLSQANNKLLSIWDVSEIKESVFGIESDEDEEIIFFSNPTFEKVIAIDNNLTIIECTVNKSKDGNTYIFTHIDEAFKSYKADLRERKLEKLIEVLGEDWFKDKKIFELGCGHAHVSAKLYELGADVYCSDARTEHIEYVNKTYPFIKTSIIDQNSTWKLDKEYDLIISWGVNEHLENWKQDLKTTIRSGKRVTLDMVISEKDTFTCAEEGFDSSIHKIGSRPTIADVNKILEKDKKEFKRYDDAELNFVFVEYDWEDGKNKDFNIGHRRFWISE